jgi:hypothetical protein
MLEAVRTRVRSSHLDVGALQAWTAGLSDWDAASAIAALGVALAAGKRDVDPDTDWFAKRLLAALDGGDSIDWTLAPVLEASGALKVDALASYSAAGFATTWRATTPAPEWEDQHVPSLALQTGSLDLASAAWLSARLRRELIGRGSFVTVPDLGSGPAFRWPLRVGLLADPASQALRTQLEALADAEAWWIRNIIDIVEPAGPDTPIEILLWPGSLETVMAVAEADRHGFEAACVMALGGLGDLGGSTADELREALLASIDPSAVAVATVPGDQVRAWFRDMAETFSHDQTLDVAMQTATTHLGGGAAALVVGDPAALVAMRVQSAAMRAIDALPVAGPETVLLPAQTAAELNLGGLDVGGGRVELARDVIVMEFLRPQLYDHETHGATSVSALNRLMEAEWDEPQPAMAAPPEMDAVAGDDESLTGGPIGDEGWDMVETGGDGGEEPPKPAPPAAPKPVRVKPRFILAQVWERPRRKGGDPVTGRLAPKTRHDLDVRIGPKARGWIGATKAVDLTEVTRDGDRHRLRIVFAPDGRPPQVRSVLLPAVGTSTTCTFRLDTPASGSIRGRIIVSYRNRVLQTALLTGAVDSAGVRRQVPIRITTEAIVRPTFQRLSARRPFDLAIVHNHAKDGKPGVTAVQGAVAVSIPTVDLGQEVDAIHTWLTAAAEDPTAYSGLKKKDTVELLFKLARRGINLRRSVVDAKDLKGLGDPAKSPRIQVVAAKADAYFPIEFFYDFPTPSQPVLCKNAAIALQDGHCDPANHGPVAADGTIGVVCPVGFWAMNRVIERHAPLGESGAGLETSPFAAGHGGAAGRPNRLPPLSSAMFAWSDRVQQKDADAVAKTLATATGGHLTSAATWVDWVGAITDAGPDLLLLLSHSERDPLTDEATLVIAAADAAATSVFGPPYVRLEPPSKSDRKPIPGPMVFLLGCDTATPWTEYQTFVGVFRYFGAEIVVGTIATVAASHAANVASRLVKEVAAQAPKPKGAKPKPAAGAAPKPAAVPVAFGDVLLTARRNLLAGGEVMALTLTSYGDSDVSLA